MKHQRVYSVWKSMRYRCKDPKNMDYFGRGIKVCTAWRNDFYTFQEWALDNGYQDSLVIDRKNNDKGYSPSNCRWVTPLQNSANRRNSRLVTYKGKTYTTREISELAGISQDMANNRFKLGWSVEKIIMTPGRKTRKKYEYNGSSYTITELSKLSGIKYDTLHQRIKSQKWSVKRSVEEFV